MGSICSTCGSVYHDSCFSQPTFSCVTCEQYKKRQIARKQILPPEPHYSDGGSGVWRQFGQQQSLMSPSGSVFSNSFSGLDCSVDPSAGLGFGSSPKSNTLWSVQEDE